MIVNLILAIQLSSGKPDAPLELPGSTNDTLTTTSTQAPTTLLPIGTAGCIQDGEFYADGALITTEDPCEHCYCMKGDFVCAVHECKSSLDEEQEGCAPKPAKKGECCPESYVCRKLISKFNFVQVCSRPTFFSPFSYIFF